MEMSKMIVSCESRRLEKVDGVLGVDAPGRLGAELPQLRGGGECADTER